MDNDTPRPPQAGTETGMVRAGRTTSLARSITWSYWWRRFLSFLFIDLVIVATLLGCFVHASQTDAITHGAGQGHLAIRRTSQPLEAIAYDAPLKNGEPLSYLFWDYVSPFAPALIVVAAGEVFGLMALPLSTRRVRRKLQPLNDLALAAEEIRTAADMDFAKMQTLEEAIQSASVDSPHVSTGDRDLHSIEVALNGLLRQMQEAKLQQMRFVDDASHELRTPIAVIRGYVDMLDRWGKSDEEVLDESIAALKTEADHMSELVDQLLFLARGDAGRTALQRESLNLAEITREVWEESRMIDDAHTYTLDVPGEGEHDEVFQTTGDIALVKQSLRILVQNAARYSGADTEIALGVGADEQSVWCRVQDEGLGMSQQQASHVFERFYRSEEARETYAEGSGLGLSLAKWIVDAHGGSIEVLSSEGVGTRFTIRLPRC